jgi:exonuclease-1
MGVDQLLQTLAAASVQCNMFAHFHGRVVGVDASVLLHLAMSAHAGAVALHGDYNSVVPLFMTYIDALVRAGGSPMVVFDNPDQKYAPKQRVDAKRAKSRAVALQRLAAGGLTEKQTATACTAACATTPALVASTITALRSARIPYVVAPYEADSQLALLAAENVVDIVWANDSDLLVHGIPRCLLKWDKTGTHSQLYGVAQLAACEPAAIEGVPALLLKVDGARRVQLPRCLAVVQQGARTHTSRCACQSSTAACQPCARPCAVRMRAASAAAVLPWANDAY